MDMTFPVSFKPILCDQQISEFLAIRRPPSSKKSWSIWRKKFKTRMVGVSSNRAFPNIYPHIARACLGWCHCFRNPEQYIPSGVPLCLISESDFVNYDKIRPIKSKKNYDFVYVCQSSQKSSKNYALFLKSLNVFASMNIKGVVIGTIVNHPSVTSYKFVPRKKLFRLMSSAKFAFFPNRYDASPRVLSESLCLNIPIVVNGSILGGWKYVNESTGIMFKNDLSDLKSSVESIVSNTSLRPREYFADNYGPYKTGHRLKEFLISCGRIVKNKPYIIPPYWRS